MGNELRGQNESDPIGTVDLVGRLRDSIDAAKARRLDQRDHEVEDTKGITWHQTGPDEAHERWRCETAKCGWEAPTATQPAGEHHTGSLNLTGEGNPEPVTTELAASARVLAHRVRQDADNIDVDIRHPRLTMENHARDLERLAEKIEAVYPAIRQHVAEQIAVALDAVPGQVYPEDIFPPDGTSIDCQSARVMRFAYPAAANIAREIGGGQ